MFPDPGQVRRRIAARLDRAAGTSGFRIGVSTLLVIMHLVLFTIAGHERLDLPFHSAPGQAPSFSDPEAPELRPILRQPHYWSRLVVSRWDSQHYISFAIRGVTSCPT